MSWEVKLEKMAEGVWEVKLNSLRAGQVIGGNRRYRAETTSGSLIGMKATKLAAVDLVVNKKLLPVAAVK